MRGLEFEYKQIKFYIWKLLPKAEVNYFHYNLQSHKKLQQGNEINKEYIQTKLHAFIKKSQCPILHKTKCKAVWPVGKFTNYGHFSIQIGNMSI